MGKMHRKEIWSIFARVLEGNDQLLKNKSGYKKHAKRQIMMYFNASWVRKYLLLLVFAILALPVLGVVRTRAMPVIAVRELPGAMSS